jgi:uncharacterized protein YndB with AHSA1/START domain
MIDIERQLGATQREVGTTQLPAGEARVVTLRRTYDAPIGEVWDALTTPERINRWFLPISGDFRLGGTYQFEGNAGGTVVACERPNRLKVTWLFGEGADPEASFVELRLSPAGDDATAFVLEHTAVVPDEMWSEYGPGAVGAGWDGGVLGLALHLEGGTVGDPIAWQSSDEGRAFFTRASESWGVANAASGADPEVVARGVANTTTFYTVDATAAS